MEPGVSDPSSLDAVLEQMEVSTGPDLESQDLITACAEDLHLGGEVEIRDRDTIEARQPSGTGSQKQRDAETEGELSEAAGTMSAVTNFIFQGGAPGEEGEGVEDVIAMEIEVTRKWSSSGDGSVSPAESSRVREQVLPETGGGWGEVGVASDAGGEQVEENNSAQEALEERSLVRGRGTSRGRGAHRGRGRRRGLYIPPVTEWRDFLDSQDMLQEYARNVERGEEGKREEEGSQGEVCEQSERQEKGEERGGEEREEQTNGEVQEFVVKEVENKEKEKEETEVGDGVFDEQGHKEEVTERRREEDEEEISVDVENTETGEEEDRSDPPMEVGVDGGDSANKGAGDPDHLEMFLPSHVPLHRQALPTSRAATTTGLSRCLEVAECFLEKERELLLEATWVPSSGGDDSRQPLAQATNLDPASVVLSNNVSRTERSSPSQSSEAASTENHSTTPPRRAKRSPLTVSLPQSRGGGGGSSTALQDEDTHSDSSFFYHDSQMDAREEEEGERAVTLSSLSASSEYESAMETNAVGDSGPDRSEPAEGDVGRKYAGKINLQRLTSGRITTSCTQRNSEAENHTNAALIPSSNLTDETQQLLQHTSVAVREDVGTWRAANKRRIKGRAGRKGKRPRPGDCRVDVFKIRVDKIGAAYSSEENDIVDLLTDTNFPGVPSMQGHDSWTSFHKSVDKLPLPSATSEQRRNKTTSKGSKPLTRESPPLKDFLFMSLFDSKGAQRVPGLSKPDALSAFNELVELNLRVPGSGAGSRGVSVFDVTEMERDCHHHAKSVVGTTLRLQRRKYATPLHSQPSTRHGNRQVLHISLC